MDKCDSQKNFFFFKEMQHVLLHLPTPSQPFHARGRFELVAGCMGKKGRGLVEKRQQATEMHNPARSGFPTIRMQFQKNTCKHLQS